MKLSRKLLALVAFIASTSLLKANTADSNTTDANSTRPATLAEIDKHVVQTQTLGKPFTAVYFTATWCPASRSMNSKVVDFSNEYGDETNIVIVSLDGNTEFYKRYDVPWIVLKQSGHKQIKELFNIKYIPKVVLLNPDGQQMDRDDWKKRKKTWNITNK